MKEIVVREDVERMNFEAWCKVRNPDAYLKIVVDDDDGHVYYDSVSIDYAWQGWIARAYESAKAKQGTEKMKTDQQVKFIKELGGVSAVAEICGITRGAVSQWQKNGIPKAQMNFLKAKFPVQYKQISDDINPNQGAEK